MLQKYSIVGIRKLFFIVLFGFGCLCSFATTHTIMVQNYSFTPNTLNAAVGDTVVWMWMGGSHTTTSDAVPAGAATWNHALNSSSTSFTYPLVVGGNYSYHCEVHGANVMSGTLSVTGGISGIATPEMERPVLLYSQPFKNNLTVNLNNNSKFTDAVTIQVYNILGDLQYEHTYADNLSQPVTLDLSDLNAGIYLVSVVGANTRKTFRVVKSE